MIDRYTPSEFKDIFSDESRFESYLKVELTALKAHAENGLLPMSDFEKAAQKAHINLKRIAELEEITRHDVVAFTRSICEELGEEKRFFHYGLTSTDVVDTGMAILYQKANNIIENDFLLLLESLKQIALIFKYQPAIARTHGMHAEVTSFGLRWANFYDEGKRALASFKESRALIECVKISGAVGDFANIDPSIQNDVAKSLGLSVPGISSQVLTRDRHARYASSIALAGGLIERIALEIRNLSRTEIGELEEGFSKGQKGSSAMPQKRNPISSENLTGCARMLRGYLIPIMEDEALYHERDISHSSVERVALQDMIILFDYMLQRMIKTLDSLSFFPKRMEENISLTHGAIYAQKAMNALILKGMLRDDAYDLIQPLAMEALKGEKDFRSLLEETPKIREILGENGISSIFDAESPLHHVDDIYRSTGIE